MDTRFNTLFIGKVLLEYDRLDSTNSQAERLLKERKLADGTAILAYDQFSGRGQMGNSWFSESYTNLTTSIILYPKIDFPKQQFYLNQAIALGVRDCIAYWLEDVWVKWPNDIYVGGKKIAGILIQNSIQRRQIGHSIVGVGINVNQGEFPEGIGQPTSVYLENGKNVLDIKVVLACLCSCIEKWYMKLKQGKYDEIESVYHQFLYMKGIPRKYQLASGDVFQGEIERVLPDGRLEMSTHNGLQTFMFKEISMI